MSLLVLIIALLAVALLLRIDFIIYIVYVCIGIYLISRWYTPRALRGLRISRDFSPRAFLGETVPIALHWHNAGWLPLPWVEFTESVPPKLRLGPAPQQALTLGRGQTTAFTYTIQAGQRGYYRVGPLRLTAGDLFGLTPRRTGYLEPDFLTVYPQILPLEELGLPSRLPFGTVPSQQRLFEDPARPMGVRDYRSGDSPRMINWKVSAHTRDLLVKRLEPAISLETAVLLNLHAGDYHRRDRYFYTEWGIIVAASLAAHLVDQRQAVGLITNGVDPLQDLPEDAAQFDESSGRLLRLTDRQSDEPSALPPAIPPRNGRAHLMKVLEHLARLESDDTIPFNTWSVPACMHLSWGVTILAITADGDEATCQTLHRLVRAGFNPILIAVEPDYNFGQVRERARRLGFRAFNVADKADLGHLRARHRLVVP